jgi:copper transport protein
MKRLLLLLGALFCLGLVLAGPALAHATLLSSSPADGARLPAAPRVVTLSFDEPVGLGAVGYLHVTDQSGRRVDTGPAFHPDGDDGRVADWLRAGLGDGSYTASYRVISADSHPVTGSIAFVVGNGPLVRAPVFQASTVDPVTGDAFDAARWVSYAGLVLLGGGWLIFTVWPAGRDEPRARRLVWGGWVGLVAGALLELLLQGPYSAGRSVGQMLSGSLIDDTLHTDYGQLHSVRLLFLGVLAFVLARALQPAARPAPIDGAAGVVVVEIVWTFSRAGHPATTPPAWLSVPIDMAHLLAVATWLGGLIMLVGAVLPRREPGELRAVLPVFSTVALSAVLVLVASGTYSAWRGIGTVHALTTTYALIVLGKVVLLVAILLAANLSRRLVHGRVVAYAMTDAALAAEPELDDDEEVRVERLRRAVVVEAVIGLVVLMFSAVLVAEPRGEEALLADYRKPITATAPLAQGRSLQVVTSSGVHGPITFTVTLPAGARPTSVTATATQHGQQIGPLPILLHRDGRAGFDGTATLAVAGAWELDFVVTTSRFSATTTNTTIRLH